MTYTTMMYEYMRRSVGDFPDGIKVLIMALAHYGDPVDAEANLMNIRTKVEADKT